MPLRYTAALLTLATPNFDALTQFYSQFLSLEPAVLLPNVYAEFHLPSLKLGIFRPKATSPTPHSLLPTPPSPTGMSLCLEVENLEAAIAHLTQLGYPLPGDMITASHGREIYAYDPDGNWLILNEGVVGRDEA
ncbi:MAG TPA: VOC family protein [Crinalium sp.]